MTVNLVGREAKELVRRGHIIFPAINLTAKALQIRSRLAGDNMARSTHTLSGRISDLIGKAVRRTAFADWVPTC